MRPPTSPGVINVAPLPVQATSWGVIDVALRFQVATHAHVVTTNHDNSGAGQGRKQPIEAVIFELASHAQGHREA